MKHARAVRDGKVSELIFIEGLRLCEEAVKSDSLAIEDVLYTERIFRDERSTELLKDLRHKSGRIVQVEEEVLASVSDTKTPQGIIALAKRPRTQITEFQTRAIGNTPLLVILHRINNPSNAGAMLRVAEAAEATGVISTEGTTDLFSAKALRGAMGSTFRLPLWTDAALSEILKWCKQQQIKTVSTDLRAAVSHTKIDWTIPRAIILGEEASGLSASESQATDESVRIPMRPPVESLNVAVSLAVVLYEAARQKRSTEY